MLCSPHVVPGKTYGALLCALLLCALGACGSGGSSPQGTPPPQSENPPPDPDPDPEPDPDPNPDPDPTPDPDPDPNPDPDPPPDPDPDPNPPTGEATVTWAAPTTNVDGSALTDLAGFRIYYGTAPDALESMIELDDAALTRHVVGGLTLTTWYFAVSAFTTSQTESGYALVASAAVH